MARASGFFVKKVRQWWRSSGGALLAIMFALVTVRPIVAYMMLRREAHRQLKSDSSIATGSETRNLAADLYGEALI